MTYRSKDHKIRWNLVLNYPNFCCLKMHKEGMENIKMDHYFLVRTLAVVKKKKKKKKKGLNGIFEMS